MKLLMLLSSWLYFVSFMPAAMVAEPAVIEGAKKEASLVFYTTM